MIAGKFLFQKSSFLQGAVYMALVAILVPAYTDTANAAIDEKMPSSIPAEILADWKDQGGTAAEIQASLPEEYAAKCDGSFESACHWRRVYRMSQFPQMETIMFARTHNVGSIAIGFWVNVGSREITDDHFESNGALCLLKFDNYYSQYEEILTKNDMCVKDPCISLDGKKVVFAMSSGRGRGFLIYEMEIDNPGSVKQLTEYPAGLTVADFEPCYLPNGDIMFSSTRCFGTIDCGWQPTSNMFIMDSIGRYMRRVGYDQVHTFYPVLSGSGNVIYTRWEYNDRDIANIMGIFRMNPDGCHQTEVFGNQTTWPMNMFHARPVPGSSSKFFAVAGGHHGSYAGEVFVADNALGTNGPEHITMVSPPRATETRDKNDAMAMGGTNKNSTYPYPLNEEWYLVSYRDVGQETFGNISNTPYRIYLKHIDGKSRELLAWNSKSLQHPVVVAPWKEIWGTEPVQVARQANFNDSVGIVTMQDVYFGAGMEGIDKASGIAKSLRVIEIKYRVSGACDQGYAGMLSGAKPSGVIFAAPNINPPSLWGASWDAKKVLGEAKIYKDGSAAFTVPARTPLYFQVLDSNGCSIAGMRSWATLMPGETFACYGCHENKSEAPPPVGVAMAGQPKPLEKPLGIEDQPFDFVKFVQPILDKHCVSCHGANHASGLDLRGDLQYNSTAKKSFARSYTSLLRGIGSSTSNKAINIATIFSQAPQMPPRSFGSTQSGMIKNVLSGHQGVDLTADEIKTLACWIDLEAPHAGTYDSYMQDADAQKYKSLEASAQKWYDMEAKNVRELAATQIPIAVRPHGNEQKKITATGNRFRIGYLPIEHALVLKHFHQGTLLLVNLRGRVITRMDLSDLHTDGTITLALPASLGTGLYIARLESVNGSEQAKVSITR